MPGVWSAVETKVPGSTFVAYAFIAHTLALPSDVLETRRKGNSLTEFENLVADDEKRICVDTMAFRRVSEIAQLSFFDLRSQGLRHEEERSLQILGSSPSG